MNLFGKAKPKGVAPKDAITKLRETLETLEKREAFLQKKIDEQLVMAKKNASANRRVAMLALKRKKQYENELNKNSGARMTLETQMMTIENANVNLEALNAMKIGSQAMKSIHGEMDINKVDATMEDIRDQMDLANEISDAISQPVGFGIDMDEDELAAELDALEQEEMDAKLLNVGAPSVAVPATASKAPAQPQFADEEDDELAELRASMAL